MIKHEQAHMDSKKLWCKVKNFFRMGHGVNDLSPPNITAEWLNAHYATISTDSSYVWHQLRTTVNAPHDYISEWKTFRVLDTLRHTATGPDNLPVWFLRLAWGPTVRSSRDAAFQYVLVIVDSTSTVQSGLYHSNS